MAMGVHKVQGYLRRQNGKRVYVEGYWAKTRSTPKQNPELLHTCVRCGAKIAVVKMPNGGWGHFEGAAGLSRVPHSCFTIGRSVSRRRDADTLDLFESLEGTETDRPKT